MAFDFKKEYKDLYMPKTTPKLITVPPMNFISVAGTGNPNDEDGEYKQAVGVLYALCYTIKMSKMGAKKITDYYDFVVPPLEGLWWMGDNTPGIDYGHKELFSWISMIRQPDFVTEDVFKWACAEAEKKKGIDTSKAKFGTYDEGLSVRCMHIGAFDDEPATLDKIHAFAEENGYTGDITDKRFHHEIYLGDPRKGDPAKHKTVLSIPVRPL